MYQYTIQQLLTKLKTTEDRINRAMGKPLCGMITGTVSRTPVEKVYADELALQNTIKSNGDAIQALVRNVAKAKLAIAQANLNTFITVNGESISITEAIIQRGLLAKKKEMHRAYQNQLANLQRNASKIIEDNQRTMDSRAVSPEELAASRIAFEQYRQPTVIGYCGSERNISDYLQKLEKDIEYYETEYDSALSQVNASTIIALDFEV